MDTSTSQFLQKIQAPVLSTPILHRETLVQLLANWIDPASSSLATSSKLVLLCTPAGYGKTTLLADTIQQTSVPSCWYFLESSDTPVVFFRGLLASVQQRFPSVGKHLEAVLSDADAETDEDWQKLLDLLIDAFNSEISQYFVLVLCDYHNVQQNNAISRLINYFLVHPLQRAVLVIESRSLPNLDLAPLIARRQMFGLGSNRLRFTARELYELAHLQGFTTFSLQEAEYLTESFGGWIAGILLGSNLGYTQMHPMAPFANGNWGTLAQHVDHQQLSTYIANEVFSQERAMYEFLEAVSILHRLTPERCNALLEITDAAERLIYAEQHGLFVVRSEEVTVKDVEKYRRGVYVCHPVLRALFRESLRRQAFSRYLALHRKAAHLLLNDLEYEQALMHALQAQEYSLAISILTQRAPGLMTHGYSEIVNQWLDILPKYTLQQDPWLLMTQATIHLARNEYAQVAPLLDALENLPETAFPNQASSAYFLLQAELRLARSKLLFYQGNFQQAQELCQEVLHLLPADEISLHIRARQRLGVCLTVGSGRIQEGIMQFQQAIQLSSSLNDEQQTAMLHRLLASAYGWIGTYELADYHQKRALDIWEKQHKPWGIINNLISTGLLKLRQGMSERAEELLMNALHLAQDVYHFKSGEAYALVALGELCCTLAHYVRALAYLEDGLRLAKQCEDRYLIHCGLCSIATAYLFMGEIQTSQLFLSQVTLQKQEEHTYEGLLRSLTQGRLFLAQQTYDLAQQELEHAVILGKRTNIRFLHIQALLLLAVCHVRQQKIGSARKMIRKVAELNKKGDFDYALKIETRCYSELSDLLAQVARADQISPEETSLLPRQEVPLSSFMASNVSSNQEQGVAYKLRIQAFGETNVFVDDVPITHWHLLRAQELFFLLLETAHPVPKDKLIEALWPNTTSEQIDTTMRTAVYYLRQAIGKSCVVYRSGLYSLNLSVMYGEQIWYDVALFDAYYTQGKKALKEDENATANTAFANLVALYKGDYLQSFYNNWCTDRRDRLRTAYMDAREQLALFDWQRECWQESIEHWRAILALDPCFEKAHYGIMRCYLQQGNRELALRQYQRCCQYLQEELQTTPGSSIQKLYLRINQS